MTRHRTSGLKALLKDLKSRSDDTRAATLARLSFRPESAKAVLLPVVAALDDDAEQVREAAEACLGATYPDVPLPPRILASLRSGQREERLAGICEVVRILPDVEEAIIARRPGWRAVRDLTAHSPRGHPLFPSGSRGAPSAEGKALGAATEGTMERRKEKRAVDRIADGQRGGVGAKLNGRYPYLIRIPREADQERALLSFRGVHDAVHSAGEDEFLVTGEHLKALRRAGVPFEDITEPPGDHGEEEAR
jgi:hypothetical protein